MLDPCTFDQAHCPHLTCFLSVLILLPKLFCLSPCSLILSPNLLAPPHHPLRTHPSPSSHFSSPRSPRHSSTLHSHLSSCCLSHSPPSFLLPTSPVHSHHDPAVGGSNARSRLLRVQQRKLILLVLVNLQLRKNYPRCHKNILPPQLICHSQTIGK